MSSRNKRNLKRKQSLLRNRRQWIKTRRDRRGVLLMVVLSMLALFLLLGTAFMVSSNFYQDTAKEAAKLNRTTNNPTDLLERAMLQVLRDTNNPSSAIRFHSLLRDQYGTDGFIGDVYPVSGDGWSPQYAGAAAVAPPYGPTDGQLIDIFVADLVPPGSEIASSKHVIKLERDPTGLTVDHRLPVASDYYNGSLLTMLTGPAAGQSTRIVDYALVGLTPQADPGTGVQAPVFRIRVMAFSRADGQPLKITAANELEDLFGHAFMVNGRPFNGTGAGYNRLAQPGTPRLNASEALVDSGGALLDTMPIALLPNFQFLPTGLDQFEPTTGASVLGDVNPGGVFTPFGSLTTGQVLYPTAEGPGGSDESYDAPDYQNMFLAYSPLTPRARAGLMDATGAVYELDSQDARDLIQNTGRQMRLDTENTIIPSFHRPALVNYWYQRLLNAQWLIDAVPNENLRALAIVAPYGANGIRNDQPPTPSDNPSGVALNILDQIAAIHRKIILRPIAEDHPNFDGSNSQSRTLYGQSPGRGAKQLIAANGQIRSPFWETVGPWDVDNDNDGVADSVWVDLGDPVQKTEDGRLLKPLYAILVIDLDNRLDLNAHGSVDHLVDTNFDPVEFAVGNVGNLTGGDDFKNGFSAIRWSSNRMPQGMGWGPGDVTLRPIFSPLTAPYSAAYQAALIYGDPATDDLARLFMGRVREDKLSDAVWGKLGSVDLVRRTTGMMPFDAKFNVKPGLTFDLTNTAMIEALRDPAVPFEFYGYPVADQIRSQRLGAAFTAPTSFGTSPDLRGRYAPGIDYTGQPVNEAVWDSVDPTNMTGPLFVSVLDDSPYETNYSRDSRRGLPSSAFSGVDDAPFEVAELERLLRAYDQATGTEPSRLWDLVDTFDPNKSLLTIASNPNNPTPEELALAQALTAIARAQVTTDTSEVPAPADVAPSYITELGPDGVPGNLGDDDGEDSDNDGNPDEDVALYDINTGLGEIGWRQIDSDNRFLSGWSDDFSSLVGKSVTDARLVDVLWYRIQRNRIERGMRPYNFLNAQAILELNRISEQLLPPEVLAGYKMDVNRPFGDGRDNNGNGVVDEPIEAGEPYLDTNNDGRWESGEPFIDLDGDGRFYADKDEDGVIDTLDLDGDGFFEPVVDSLWGQQLGGTPALLSNAMGKDVSGRVVDNNGAPLRDDNHLARQLYARHLYVMTMLLADENYVAPYDRNDAQAKRYLRLKAKELEDAGMTKPQSKLAAQRKYTCRQVAQWAVNCVDFRDSDAAMTPFEYDENPWDGWNCVDRNGTPNDPTDDTILPIDSDPGTDENYGQFIDWDNMAADGVKVVGNLRGGANPTQRTDDKKLDPLDRTRNIVWGAERPELLITETMAFHDLRQEDLENPDSEAKGDKKTKKGGGSPEDEDLDQRLRPRGSLFVELYNPWSADGQRPVELYSKLRRDNAGNLVDNNGDGQPDVDLSQGVELGRVSTLGETPNSLTGKRSPVWRLIVVEEFPEYRNPDGVDDTPVTRDDKATTRMTHYVDRPTSGIPGTFTSYDRRGGKPNADTEFRPTDPDWEEMLVRVPRTGVQVNVPMSEWLQERTGEENATLNDYKDEPKPITRRLFSKPYPYIEREFYFTSGNQFFAYKDTGTTNQSVDGQPRRYTDLNLPQLRQVYAQREVRIPFHFVANDGDNRYSLTFRFPGMPYDRNPNIDVAIAPILPGRYGVVGSAGAMYRPDGAVTNPYENAAGTPRFVTTVGRILAQAGNPLAMSMTTDDNHLKNLKNTRRIELMPSANPLLPQVLVGSNGGNPNSVAGARDNEMFFTTAAKNVFDQDADREVDQNSQIVAPAVAVPVEDMNISTPVYGYEVRERELEDLQPKPNWRQQEAHNEGAYVRSGGFAGQEGHFDVPFDIDGEFTQEGTVPNYRVVHLQRLADPTLPWNPPPGSFAHEDSPTTTAGDPILQQHDPQLPVNPYLTVDSASVDLTVFNGTASTQKPSPGQFLRFRSQERGDAARLAAAGADAQPLRALWAQEPASTPDGWAADPDVPLTRDRTSLPMAIQTQESTSLNHFDKLFNHTLGYANRSFGEIFLRPESGVTSPVVDPTDVDSNINTLGVATGAPRRDGALLSTYPWFTWNNRPYVSSNELLQVPASSSSRMLWDYSTMNTLAAVGEQFNAYYGDEKRDTNDVFLQRNDPTAPDADKTNIRRYATEKAKFGHLLNMEQTSNLPAEILGDAMGDPVPVGAPNYHRVLDYLHTPSRFVATDTILNASVFNANTFMAPDDPRQGLVAPFNRVPEYREPGKVNLNTVRGQRLPGSGGSDTPLLWSDVYDGLMHRVRDRNASEFLANATFGHFGPAWRDVVLSRRGYVDPTVAPGGSGGVDRVDLVLDSANPTFFANPFRSSEAGDLAPLPQLITTGVEVSMLRSHPYKPGKGFAWGQAGNDDDGNGLKSDTRDAGYGDGNPFNPSVPGAQVPLFSELSTTPAIDGARNPGMHYMPLTRLDNLTTTRSGVFAVWVTVGYFEMLPAPDFNDNEGGVRDKFTIQAGGDPARGRALYNRVYPQGYTLGKELGSETGDIERHRGFYIIDRTRPVAFKPGEDVNVENAILLRRRIE